MDRATTLGGLAAPVFLLSACASSQVGLTVHSQPIGAYITEVDTGAAFGLAPQRAAYEKADLAQHIGVDGCALVRGFVAQWASGARTELRGIRLCDEGGDEFAITIMRDASLPGIERDMEFAVQVQALWAAQQQAAAAGDAAMASRTAAAAALVGAIQQARPLSCTSIQSGTALRTICR